MVVGLRKAGKTRRRYAENIGGPHKRGVYEDETGEIAHISECCRTALINNGTLPAR